MTRATSLHALTISIPLLLAACTSSVDSNGVNQAKSIPRPTERRLDDGAEAEHKADRRAWMREMHRAAPGIDWQAIELRNGEREMERRIALEQAAQTSMVFSRWTEVGSRNQAGRMHCATLSPDATQLYAGSSLGGIWRGNIDGTNWTPLGDNLLGRYGVAHLVVDRQQASASCQMSPEETCTLELVTMDEREALGFRDVCGSRFALRNNKECDTV